MSELEIVGRLRRPKNEAALYAAAYDAAVEIEHLTAAIAAQQDGAETIQHIGWLKQYAEMMDETNWKDMRALIQRQLADLSAQQDGALAELKRLHAKHGEQATADVIRRLEQGG